MTNPEPIVLVELDTYDEPDLEVVTEFVPLKEITPSRPIKV